jgi:putative membrane protein insertion efficiency factor
MLALIRGYQLALSPLLGPRCRYYPSCSHYAAGAIGTHGPIVGVFLGSWRILRCHPWTPGGIDRVPPRGRVVEYLRHGLPDDEAASVSVPAASASAHRAVAPVGSTSPTQE